MDIWATRAIGKEEDLEEIREDIKRLGYSANYIETKTYSSTIRSSDGTIRKIDGESTQLFVNSQSLSVLLYALGVPKGNKSKIEVKVPEWIKKSKLWVKRLYLAGLFGAELTKPCQRKDEPYGFTEPSFSQNKINSLERQNLNFLLEIINMLSEFGVRVNKVYKQTGVVNVKGEETHKLALRISASSENLISLWGRVGYEYCKKRRALSMIALAYLKHKQKVLTRTKQFVEQAKKEVDEAVPLKEIRLKAEQSGINYTMLRAQMYRKNAEVRISKSFPTFSDFVNNHKIDNSEFVIDEAEEIDEVDYNGNVYDLTMNDANHNFIANGIVSHNCGMRLVTTNLTFDQVKPHLKELVDNLFQRVPAGVGSSGFLKPTKEQFRNILVDGAKWCVKEGYGWEEDCERTEEDGAIKGADPSKVSDKAIKRGLSQIGTLGSGNHYLELQVVKPEFIFDEEIAKAFGIFPNQVVVMFHCGSRGFGHQVASEYLEKFLGVMESKYNIKILDRELACAPFQSPEGQDYFAAMKTAINMSFANRQVILHRIREAFSKIFKQSAENLGMHQVYDVAHNTAKVEHYNIDGKTRKVLVHRKGATRSFGPNRDEVPAMYRKHGQPVIIGGSMETGSYLLVGTDGAMEKTWGSTCHGSGRTMSRTQAKHQFRGDKLLRDMWEKQGIYVRAVSAAGAAEEAGAAYKNVDDVINAAHKAGISSKVVRFIPVGNVKG
ncbi:RtcB family protein [Candidatus Woesearchaeota archaeon]|nr:RtcB family protein [Candidatus Woesearchaeota archaeon]